MMKNLGVKPRYGWSIDPFGHSPTMAYLLQNAGFEAAVINRCDIIAVAAAVGASVCVDIIGIVDWEILCAFFFLH